MKNKITFNEYWEIEQKLEITVGQIIHVSEVPKSKLLNLKVSFGEHDERTCLTNIKEHLTSGIESLIGLNLLFVTNLEPIILKGIESQVIILPGELTKTGKMFVLSDSAQLGTKLI